MTSPRGGCSPPGAVPGGHRQPLFAPRTLARPREGGGGGANSNRRHCSLLPRTQRCLLAAGLCCGGGAAALLSSPPDATLTTLLQLPGWARAAEEGESGGRSFRSFFGPPGRPSRAAGRCSYSAKCLAAALESRKGLLGSVSFAYQDLGSKRPPFARVAATASDQPQHQPPDCQRTQCVGL